MKLSIDKLKELLPGASMDRRGKNLRAKCPMCGEDEFGISLEDNHIFGCYRRKKCGWHGNIFTLVKFLQRWDILNLEGEVGNVSVLANLLTKIDNAPIDLELPTIVMPVGWRRVMQDPYMDSRGFVDYEQYPVGRTYVDPRFKNNYVIAAIQEQGINKGYIGRHVWDKEAIKIANIERRANGQPEILRYINSDTNFSKLLMGYDEIVQDKTHTIIAVEGAFDFWNVKKVMKLETQDGIKCNATFKCNISPEQIVKWLVKGVKTLILFYDPDVINQIKKTAAEVALYFDTYIAFNEHNDHDAGDCVEEDLSIIFSNLRKPSEFNSNKVASIIN